MPRPRSIVRPVPLGSVLLLLATGGCAKATDADCDRLADKIVELALSETKAGEAGKQAAERERKRVRSTCLEERPSPDQIECVVAATDKDQIPDC